MTDAAQQTPSPASAQSGAPAPEGWDALRADPDIQFAAVEVPELPPRELGWFEQALQALFQWLAEALSPLGAWLGIWWGVIQWALIALVAAFVLYSAARSFGPLARRKARVATAQAKDWGPASTVSLALLAEAESLAAAGRFDEATHLLLTRSVGELAAARPGTVEPSSTARELAALPALPEAARTAFGVIAERVERSLFARQQLERPDWEAARDAYARFALALPGGGAAA